MDDLQKKKEALYAYLKSLGKVAVAFSAGADSAFLLYCASDALGSKNVIALTGVSPSFPQRERGQSSDFCSKLEVKQIMVNTDEMSVPQYVSNPPDRCYYCRRDMFTKFSEEAERRGFPFVAEGSNIDDLGDYRPGLRAVKELGIKSPLREAGLGKADIRELSRLAGLPTWNKPSSACLASRIEYGEKITAERLERIDKAEQYLLSLGFVKVRVRTHGKVARIEVDKSEIGKFFDASLMEQVDKELKKLGFLHVALDLAGYSVGSMNAALKESEKSVF